MANNVGSMERLGRQLYLTFKVVREGLDAHMAAAGGSAPQWFVLKSLAAEPGLSHRELADRMQLSGPTLTHHLDRCEADGLIVRTRDTIDRRVVRVELTPEGKQRCADLDAVAEAADRRLQRLLTERDARTLNLLLARLHRRLTDDPPEGDHRAP
jgi:DNA-binding MarR family transcriptional regulator